MDINSYVCFVREVGDAFIKFVAYGLSMSLQGKSDDSPSKAFEILENIYGPDKRALFRSLTVIVEHFLCQLPSESIEEMFAAAVEKELEDSVKNKMLQDVSFKFREKSLALNTRYYMLIEALLLTGDAYYKNRYRWYFVYDRNAIRISNGEHLAQSPVFYNVFTYPYAEGSSDVSCLLTSVRILQYIRWHNGAEKEDLIRFLKDNFGYSEAVIRKLWEELLDAGLIRSHKAGTHSVIGRVKLTQLGEFTILHLVMTLEFLALSLESAPLPRRIVEEGLIPIAPYDNSTDFVVNNKFKSAINFLRVLQEIEKFEEDRFIAVQNKIQFSEVFKIAPQLVQGAKSALNKIVDSAYKEHQSNITKELESQLLK